MSSTKMISIFCFGIIFVVITFLVMLNVIDISNDASYLGLLIYLGSVFIIFAMPSEKD